MYKLFVAGIDEAGRGPLVGPVTAACVVLRAGYKNSKIKDSKKLSEKQRNALFNEIVAASLAHSIISVGSRRIDRLNILQATKKAMCLAAERVSAQLDAKFGKSLLHVMTDGNMRLDLSFSQESVVKGDSKLLAISAASILAKVARDRLMQTLDDKYPGYGIEAHKGYPTKFHKEQVAILGPSPAHRMTFSGVKEHAGKFI